MERSAESGKQVNQQTETNPGNFFRLKFDVFFVSEVSRRDSARGVEELSSDASASAGGSSRAGKRLKTPASRGTRFYFLL